MKARKPGKKGVRRVPVVMQLEAVECGAACLTMLLAYYGKWLPIERVRKDCGVSRDGLRATNIVKAARGYGMKAGGFRYDSVESLKDDCEFPCIIHWNFNHFVVLCGFKGGKAIINDPGRGRVRVAMDEFDRSFTGICLQISPDTDFEPEGRKKSMLSFAAKRLKGVSSAVVFMIIAAVIAALFGVINPLMARIFMDNVLASNSRASLYIFAVILFGFAVLQLAAMFVQMKAGLRINGKFSIGSNVSFMWKILRLPMEFFSQRTAGDIQMRQMANASVAETLINIFAPLTINIIMMLLYLFIMLKYSVLLSMVGILSIIINIFVSMKVTDERTNAMRVQMMNSGQFYSTTISGIRMIETIKASGAENGFFRKWAGYQALVTDSEGQLTKTNAFLGKVPELVSKLAGSLVVALGVLLCIKGNFSLGMLMTFQGVLNQFMLPVQTLIMSGQVLQEMRVDMERIDDVMEYPKDKNLTRDENVSLDGKTGYRKLSGNIELKNVTFGYSHLTDPVIKNFSMSIKPGQSIALAGATGSGKSTLSKLLSGLYEQWDGDILFDGKRIPDIDRTLFSASVSVVDQDIIIFEDTIAENIKMWDESIEDFEMILAARDAQIHDDIIMREGGYNRKLTEGGKDLSGGQRQRLEIARVLATDPTIIILDEATSALDTKTEHEVIKAIKDRGITCIVIAHRLSTIRDCDEIIVLDKGDAIERGTHDELIKNNGLYARLVANE
ncbi:MAG: NHLP family bacteriocin export ABC transporter peptidase/permease/ATPase subunit [Lachnospiraceae bacterium]|nr:NHLP family bacteriocin export ABC transporter peptidase/permease/ATPase subunit [Lachnospiraceae bacterium]